MQLVWNSFETGRVSGRLKKTLETLLIKIQDTWASVLDIQNGNTEITSKIL
jgi:hypothetical protein